MWVFANIYGYLFGWTWLRTFHRVLINFSLHGLGYDNVRYTGEERFVTKVLSKFDNIVCLDIGANVGKYTKYLVEHIGATVYAVEPSSATFKKLQQATAGLVRVHPLQVAISDHNGCTKLFSETATSETATLDPRLLHANAVAEEVRIVTVDTLVKDLSLSRIDFIKIDTEGWEYEVLKGMQQTLRDFKPKYIQFEFNILHLYRNCSLHSITEMVGEGSYEFYRLLPHGMSKIDPRRFIDNVFMFSNIVAKRKNQYLL